MLSMLCAGVSLLVPQGAHSGAFVGTSEASCSPLFTVLQRLAFYLHQPQCRCPESWFPTVLVTPHIITLPVLCQSGLRSKSAWA